ncbi:hypothetical protein KR032_004638 [Drosophila birchii]|nr:hypothetical protein KR032_004638 [Drosophila birchii]
MSSPAFVCNSMVAVLLLILAPGLILSTKCRYDQFLCVENDRCISIDATCNRTFDCPNGSAESFTVCKGPDPESEKTHCANGANMETSMYCNGIVDCLDGSDELPQICINNTNYRSKYRGNCEQTEIQCLPRECVPEYKTCNNEIDCNNGLDESLEMCMHNCGAECFRCGNGLLIEEDWLCDNYMHCLDGTDELPYVCEGRKKRVKPKICIEPTDRKFTTKTKFIVKDSKRFVYANQPAEVGCWNSDQTSWNVCMNNGKWHHEFPVCQHSPINSNPDTNGINGCPIYYYNSETMLIRKNKNKTVYPPLRDITVKFECLEGYQLLPYKLSNQLISCQDNKQWMENDIHPRCVKLCSKEEINGMYTLKPDCYLGYDGTRVTCTDQHSLIPGTIVKFSCYPGFEPNHDTDPVSVKCLEDGTWEGLNKLCLNQKKICQFECNSHLNYTYMPLIKDGYSTNAMDAHWAVPIYLKNTITNEFEFKCTGNLIRLDMVLTSAHCISPFKNELNKVLVGSTGNRSESAERFKIKGISIYGGYDNNTFKNDIGIIVLEKRLDYLQSRKIICLPPVDRTIDLPNKTTTMIGWDSNGILRYVEGLIREPKRLNGGARVILKNKSKLCQGDSGSGVTINLDNMTHIVGLISKTEGPGEVNTKCTAKVTAINLLSTYFRSFIEENLNPAMNCPMK